MYRSIQTEIAYITFENDFYERSIQETVHVVLMFSSVLLFSKFNKMFFGYFDPEKIYPDNEKK